ncbi:MAG: sigma-54 dependent transcriptional regulator [Verrucomicrobiota bacterium]|jgi:two-component system nitrogen regulation response regulator GlnG
MSKLLLIDDDQDVHYAFQRSFESPDIELTTASSGEEALRVIPKLKPDLVLLDNRMGAGLTGLETLRRIRQFDSKLLVILMTAYGTTQTAIGAMKLGAYDYLLKPFDVPKLKEVVLNALKAAREMREGARYNFEPGGRPLLQPEDLESEIVGQSEPMREVFKLIGQFASTDTTVLITGESGTGKELVAKAIWQYSDRHQGPFVAVNCAAIPEQLLESELFGHERGAFTGAVNQRGGKFEQCKGGVIFLDEIGDMTPATQTKILRVLQSRKFERVGGNTSIDADVRVIAATNKVLEQAVAAGEFREDLFYRLHGVRIHMPPLRERKGDIPLLVKYFLHKLTVEQPAQSKSIASSAMKALERFHWPGNVRELESLVRRVCVVAQGDVVLSKDLPLEITGEGPSASPVLSAQAVTGEGGASELVVLARQLFQWARRDPKLKVIPAIERELVIQALKETEGNQVHAAKLLGITRATLRKRVEKFGIQRQLSIK